MFSDKHFPRSEGFSRVQTDPLRKIVASRPPGGRGFTMCSVYVMGRPTPSAVGRRGVPPRPSFANGFGCRTFGRGAPLSISFSARRMSSDVAPARSSARRAASSRTPSPWRMASSRTSPPTARPTPRNAPNTRPPVTPPTRASPATVPGSNTSWNGGLPARMLSNVRSTTPAHAPPQPTVGLRDPFSRRLDTGQPHQSLPPLSVRLMTSRESIDREGDETVLQDDRIGLTRRSALTKIDLPHVLLS